MQENVHIISIQTDGAVNNLKSLQAETESLKNSLSSLKEGTEEYQEVVDKLAASENELKSALDTISNSLESLKSNFNDISNLFSSLDTKPFVDGFNEIVEATRTAFDNVISNIDNMKNGFDNINLDSLKENLDGVFESVNTSLGGFKTIIDGISESFEGMDIKPLIDSFKEIVVAVNGLKDVLSNIDFDSVVDGISEVIQSGKGLENLFPPEPEMTVKGLKEEINNLRDALLNVERGSSEYNSILERLIEDQKKLTEVMRAGKNESTAADGSYNALVNKMAALKKVWKETTDELARKNLGKEINSINDQLKKMDASIGNYQRNVGNYTQSITAAFGSMGGAAKGMIGPINGVKQAFTALSSHPIVAVLTALAGLLINGIAKGFKSSEENTNKLREAFSGFQAIGDAVTKIFQKLAGWIGDAANAVVNFADKLGLLGPKFKERQEMTRKQIELEKKERDSIVKTAQIETEAAELRAKASDEENYSISQRIEFLQQAQQKEQEQLELEKQIVEQKVAQLEAQIAIADSTGEELTKLNELKAQVIKINGQIAASQRQSNKEISALRRRGLSEQQQANQARLNLEKDLIQQEYNLAVAGSDKQLELAKELRTKELEIQKETLKAKIKNRSEYEKAMKLAIQAYNRDIEALEMNHQMATYRREQQKENIRLMALREGSSDYYKELKIKLEKEAELYVNAQEKLRDLLKENPEATIHIPELTGSQNLNFTDINEALSEVNKSLRATYDNYFKALETEVNQTNQIILAGTRPLSAMYAKQMEQIKKEIDDMATYTTDRIEEVNGVTRNISYEERIAAKEKELTDVTKNYWSAVISEHDRYKRTLEDMYLNGPTDSVLNQYKRDTEELKFANRQYLVEVVGFINQNEGIVREKLNDYYTKLLTAGQEYNHLSEDQIKESAASLTKNAMTAFQNFGQMTEEQIIEYEKNLGRVISLAGDYMKRNGEETVVDIEFYLGQVFKTSVLPDDVVDQYLANLENLVDSEKVLLAERYQNWDDLAKGIADLTGSIGDIYTIKLENEKKALEKEGKYTEQERKNLEERFKTVQTMQIAEATINTISGAIAAFMKCQELGQPWGAILGAVQAAAVTAAGVAQIMKIKQTNPYSDTSSSLSGGEMMSATVSPSVSEYMPDYSTNLTGRSDTDYLNEVFGKTKLYVSVTEINDVQNRVKVTEQESQF